MPTWIYPISKSAKRTFDLVKGNEDDVTVENFRKLVASGKFTESQWWSISRNYNDVQIGDVVYIYAGVADGDLGFIGYATVKDKHGNDRTTWMLHLKFDLKKCRMLLKQPIPATMVRKWVPYPRNTVWPFSFEAEIAPFLPWGEKNNTERKSPQTNKGRPWQPDPNKRQKVEQIAIDLTTKHYEALGYSIVSVAKDNVGWDLDATLSGKLLRIEVKGLSQKKLLIELTPNEYDKMKKYKESYRIAVVTDALGKHPFLKILSFSRKSAQWEDEQGNPINTVEKVGARITL
ncbi:hypothetical protein DCC62_10250 [candidate division KSB1 bacterium]|nr:MAG: hypothetical protein DCC62_10250 [candidate division KSB1 bacterium]